MEKEYDTPAGKFKALNGIDLQVKAGNFISVIGKSGSGKSTLINMLTGIDRPTNGKMYVGGAALHEMNEEQVSVWRGTTIGVVFQFFSTFAHAHRCGKCDVGYGLRRLHFNV